MDNSNLYQWQADILGGLKKGQLHIIGCGRRTGKSSWAAYMQQAFRITSSYTDWERVWVWPWNRKVSIYDKRIWGRIQSRYCRLSINGDGTSPTQYATDKEVFKKQLRDGKGW